MTRITVEQYAVGVLGLVRDPTLVPRRVVQRRACERVERGPGEERPVPVEPWRSTHRSENSSRAMPSGLRAYDGPNPLIVAEERSLCIPYSDESPDPGPQRWTPRAGPDVMQHSSTRSARNVPASINRARCSTWPERRSPSCRFEQGTLDRLPFGDDEFDVAIVSLALCHLGDPTAALAELSRVVRRDGTVVVTDPHPSSGIVGGQAFYGDVLGGEPMRWVRNHYHSASVWLRAFRRAELTVEDCVEARSATNRSPAFPPRCSTRRRRSRR